MSKNVVYKSVGWSIKYGKSGKLHGLYWTEEEAEKNVNGNMAPVYVVELFEEVNKYEGWPIDKPCYTNTGKAGHYAGISDNGHPCIWYSGRTSHTEKLRNPEPELFEVCS